MKTFVLAAVATALLPSCVTLAGPNDEKLTLQMQPTPKQGGFYFSIFAGANLGQSSESKDINVSGAKPIPAGTPSEIASYFLPGSNSGVKDAGVTRDELIPNGSHIRVPTFSSSTNSEIGEIGGLKFGYEFPTQSIFKPELEFEAFYNGIVQTGRLTSRHFIKGLRTSDSDGDETSEPFLNPDATIPSDKPYVSIRDQINAAVFMQNAIIKLEVGRIKPYIGAGIGLAYVTHNFRSQTGTGTPVTPNAQVIQTNYGNPKTVARLAANHSANAIENPPTAYFQFGSDEEVTFAWQGLAGVEYSVNPRLSYFAEYKALWYHDGPYYQNMLNNEVVLGVRMNF